MVKKWVVPGWQKEGKTVCLALGFFLISVLSEVLMTPFLFLSETQNLPE